MSLEITSTSSNRRQHIKKFQSRVLNRSCADFLFYDKVADYLLQCCSAQAKPNTLSLFSLIPLIVCDHVITPGLWWSYLVSIIALLMHQVFDIANKKQAYRLSQFNLTTYYLDHLYDSISCVLIVDITCKLFQFQNTTRYTYIFFFAMLPFFTHHLAMYTNGYLTFLTVSPAVEGLLILQILFFFSMIFTQIPNIQIFQFKISQIIVILSFIWLILFLIDDLRTIIKIKKGVHADNQSIDNYPLKNLFVIGIIGYIIMEMTMIEEHLLSDNTFFFLNSWTFTLLYTFAISQLVLSYGFEQKHRQLTLNTLVILFLVAIFYSICGLIQIQREVQIIIGQIIFSLLLSSQIIYFFYYNYNNVKYLNKIINDDQ